VHLLFIEILIRSPNERTESFRSAQEREARGDVRRAEYLHHVVYQGAPPFRFWNGQPGQTAQKHVASVVDEKVLRPDLTLEDACSPPQALPMGQGPTNIEGHIRLIQFNEGKKERSIRYIRPVNRMFKSG
jgi:hypothetical protein